jgi:hypothetical protein
MTNQTFYTKLEEVQEKLDVFCNTLENYDEVEMAVSNLLNETTDITVINLLKKLDEKLDEYNQTLENYDEVETVIEEINKQVNN